VERFQGAKDLRIARRTHWWVVHCVSMLLRLRIYPTLRPWGRLCNIMEFDSVIKTLNVVKQQCCDDTARELLANLHGTRC
jgi:hypothetical protein